jgi:hypothetical protein
VAVMTSIPSGVATASAAGVHRRQEGGRGLNCARGGRRMGERAKRGCGIGQ